MARPQKKPTIRQLLDFYDAWLREDAISKVAAALQVTPSILARWEERYRPFRLAKKLADERRGPATTLSKYVFKRLSKEAQAIWEEIEFWNDNEDKDSYRKIEEILSGHTKRLKQELFIHALVSSSFDPSEACHMIGLPLATLSHWKNEDLEFRQLVEEIQWHKKNFFEKALVELIEVRHPAAVIFANRTINADRGYTEKVKVEHTGRVDVGVQFAIEDLDLEPDVLYKVLEAVRRKQESLSAPTTNQPLALPAPNGKVIDV